MRTVSGDSIPIAATLAAWVRIVNAGRDAAIGKPT